MASPTLKEFLDHLLTNVLEFDTNDIKALARAGVNFYKKLISIKLKDFDTLHKDSDITMSCWITITDFKIYVDTTNPFYTFIMAMMLQSWDSVDIHTLRISQNLPSTAI